MYMWQEQMVSTNFSLLYILTVKREFDFLNEV